MSTKDHYVPITKIKLKKGKGRNLFLVKQAHFMIFRDQVSDNETYFCTN